MSQDNQLGASMMLSDLAHKVGASLDSIDLTHPGLNDHLSSKLHILQAMLEDVEHQARDMARSLSQPPSERSS